MCVQLLVAPHRVFLAASPTFHCGCGLSSCGMWAQLLGMWNLTSLTRDHLSPALEGRFLTTGPPGKSLPSYLLPFKISPRFTPLWVLGLWAQLVQWWPCLVSNSTHPGPGSWILCFPFHLKKDSGQAQEPRLAVVRFLLQFFALPLARPVYWAQLCSLLTAHEWWGERHAKTWVGF